MKFRPALIIGILLYVTLDLSLPMLPGAVVFNPNGSIEGVATSPGRAIARIVMLPEDIVGLPPVLSIAAVDRLTRTLSPTDSEAHRSPRIVSGLPRAALESPPSADDPH